MTDHKAIDDVTRILEWCVEAIAKSDYVISKEDVAARFTTDAEMITNGQVKCTGIDAHVRHFKELQDKTKVLRIRFPLEVTVTSDTECAAYYKIDYVRADGSAGVVHDSALWKTRDGKISLMVESVAFDGPEIPLENHK
jgi:ketosteroid isomerase-like protein